MSADLSRLQSPAAVQAALDEFSVIGRTRFLGRYGFVKSRDYLVRNPRNGDQCDSKAIFGAAFGYQFPNEGPLQQSDFSAAEATVVAKLQSLGFQVVRIGEDWSEEEVQATVASYFEMLSLETESVSYKKTAFNDQLRSQLKDRSKASVELKHQNISAVLHALDLPFITGYKPRGNSQLLLRKSVQQYVLDHPDTMRKFADAMAEIELQTERKFKAVVVDPPNIELIVKTTTTVPRIRLPRKIDFAARDEANRKLGRAGEQWAINFEQQRLSQAGVPELFQRLDWVSDQLGDGAGYDILSYDTPSSPRYIEVKTTNGSHNSSFVISRNEMEFAKEVGDSFYLYRIFQFRKEPALYLLRGDISKQLHLDPMDYRASFRRIVN